MKQFKLSFEDKNGNELTSKHIGAEDQREADAMAKRYFATSQINDLFVIIVTSIK